MIVCKLQNDIKKYNTEYWIMEKASLLISKLRPLYILPLLSMTIADGRISISLILLMNSFPLHIWPMGNENLGWKKVNLYCFKVTGMGNKNVEY